MGCVGALAAGAAAGLALAPSHTHERTVTVARTVVETVTRHRNVTRVKTVTADAPATAKGLPPEKAGAKPAPAPPATGTATLASPVGPTQVFGGTGAKRIGTITVVQPGGTLRWTNSGGTFRLLYGGSDVAIASTASGGSFEVPPMTYRAVRVQSGGRWTIRLRGAMTPR
jgi:hypothetical protein